MYLRDATRLARVRHRLVRPREAAEDLGAAEQRVRPHLMIAALPLEPLGLARARERGVEITGVPQGVGPEREGDRAEPWITGLGRQIRRPPPAPLRIFGAALAHQADGEVMAEQPLLPPHPAGRGLLDQPGEPLDRRAHAAELRGEHREIALDMDLLPD